MGKKPDDFIDVIVYLASKLEGKRYAIRGTASLALQGLDFNVQDIDVLTDKKTALFCNKALEKLSEKKVAYSEAEKFKSYFGTFKINEVLIEVYGDWQIKDTKGNWSEPFDASDDEVDNIEVGKRTVRVTTFKTELMMYMLMGRWSVYHKLRRLIDTKSQRNLF